MNKFLESKGAFDPSKALILLLQAKNAKFSGRLSLHRAAKHRAVFFRNGKLCDAASNDIRDSFGYQLVEWGLISKSECQESAKRILGGEGRQGDILIKMGAITPQILADSLHKHREKRLIDAIAWSSGEFELSNEGQLSDDAFVFWPMLRKGIAKRYGASGLVHAARRYASYTARRASSRYESSLADLPEALEALKVLNQHKSVGEILSSARAPMSLFVDLCMLKALGLVTIDHGGQSENLGLELQRMQKLRPHEILGISKHAEGREAEAAAKRLFERYPAADFSRSPHYQPLLRMIEEAGRAMQSAWTVRLDGACRKVRAEHAYQCGKTELASARYERAAAYFRTAYAHSQDPSHAAFQTYAEFRGSPTDPHTRDAACKAIQAALVNGRENSELFGYLGALLLLAGRYEESRAALDKALACDSSNTFAALQIHSLRLRLQPRTEYVEPDAVDPEATLTLQRWVGPHSIIYNFRLSEITIGSGSRDKIVVSSSIVGHVVARHCTIYCVASMVFLKRNRREGQVFVNGLELPAGKELEISSLDRIVLGKQDEGPKLELRLIDKQALENQINNDKPNEPRRAARMPRLASPFLIGS